MISQLHEVFLARVIKEIQDRLHTFQAVDDLSGAFARKIQHNGSGELMLRDEDDEDGIIIRHNPDASFIHDDEPWPGVILEVSFSQNLKDLSYIADDYILETEGDIRVVVGLSIDYNTKKGTISVWRPNYFTNEQGQLVLEAAETLTAQVCSLTIIHIMLHAHSG